MGEGPPREEGGKRRGMVGLGGMGKGIPPKRNPGYGLASSQKLLKIKSAMHAVISQLLHSRKFWLFILVSLLRCCFMTSWSHYLFTVPVNLVLCKIRAHHTCNSWTAASRNNRLYCIQLVASKQCISQSCELLDLGCNAVSCLPQTNTWCGWSETLIDFWCSLEVYFWQGIDHWWGRLRTCVHAKGEHVKYNLWTVYVDCVHICYLQCDLTVASLITKSCQQRWPIRSCSFYISLADLGFSGRF